MESDPKITKLEVTTFEYELPELGRDYNTFNLVYEPDGHLKLRGHIAQLHTDAGIVGEVPTTAPALAELELVADYLMDRSALERERIYGDIKRGLRQTAGLGLGIVDIMLWDIAGKRYDEPIYKLLGGSRRPLPAYASTLHGDESGGLSEPAAFVDFAERTRDMGYPAFKVHGWGLARDDVAREIETVLALGERLRGRMHLMVDPACELRGFADALALGRACDQAGFFWWEDPFADGGVSAFAHRKLRQTVRTPLLQTEHIRLLEQHVDFILADGTDFVRAGAHEDGGITGAMKIAHASEGLGLDVELHGPSPAHRHVMSAIRNTNFYEIGLVHPRVRTIWPPIYKEYHDDIDAFDADGNVWVPDGPGLGVELDWDWIRAHEVDTGELACA